MQWQWLCRQPWWTTCSRCFRSFWQPVNLPMKKKHNRTICIVSTFTRNFLHLSFCAFIVIIIIINMRWYWEFIHPGTENSSRNDKLRFIHFMFSFYIAWMECYFWVAIVVVAIAIVTRTYSVACLVVMLHSHTCVSANLGSSWPHAWFALICNAWQMNNIMLYFPLCSFDFNKWHVFFCRFFSKLIHEDVCSKIFRLVISMFAQSVMYTLGKQFYLFFFFRINNNNAKDSIERIRKWAMFSRKTYQHGRIIIEYEHWRDSIELEYERERSMKRK